MLMLRPSRMQSGCIRIVFIFSYLRGDSEFEFHCLYQVVDENATSYSAGFTGASVFQMSL